LLKDVFLVAITEVIGLPGIRAYPGDLLFATTSRLITATAIGVGIEIGS
jgi:hypothetical protein